MNVSPLLLLHICGATIGLLSGYLGMVLKKGSGWHAATGTVYFVSMLTMTISGAYIAIFVHPIMLNAVVASLTAYLVTTAWWSARHREGGTGVFDVTALLFVLAVGISGTVFGVQAATGTSIDRVKMPAGIYFVFGSIALLCAFADVRMLRRGGYTGPKRIARHLWRMCFALLIATFSLYPGQARLFPQWLRDTNLLFIPHILLLGAMIFSLVRVLRRKRVRQPQPAGADYGDALAGKVA